MKILQVMAGNDHGGAETAFVDMCIAMRDAGMTIEVATRDSPVRVPVLEKAGIKVHKLPFGGPIYTQMTFRPSACTGTDGIAADGTISWTGGGARYVYVMEANAANPGVPPNLDLPMGTIWRIDVPFTGMPISSGVRYGVVPAGTSQRFPAMGAAPAALQSGRQYYLYVMQDVAIPITRCLFNARCSLTLAK